MQGLQCVQLYVLYSVVYTAAVLYVLYMQGLRCVQLYVLYKVLYTAVYSTLLLLYTVFYCI